MAYPNLTAYPPFGQLTVISPEQDQICLTVLVEWNKVRPQYPFELSLCYTSSSNASTHSSTWTTVSMESSPNPAIVEQEDTFQSTFKATLPTSSLASDSDRITHFTVKYRVNSIAPWQWVQTQQGTLPGRLLFTLPPSSSERDLSQFIALDPGWKSVKVNTSFDKSLVYELESEQAVPKSDLDHDEEKLSTHILGRVPDLLQYMALVRLEPYWLGPRHGKDYFYIAEDAILSAFLSKSGQVVTILTMTGVDDTYSVIQSSQQGEIVIAARCDSGKDVPFRAILSIADSFDESCSGAMAHATTLANAQKLAKDLVQNVLKETAQAREAFESFLDGIAFCTWNGLGQNLTQDKILSALDSLATNNINISTLLIDDNWQTLGPIPDHDYSDSFFRGFSSIPCNTSVAPDGLSTLINKIKSSHPNIIDIGVWHALMGYWGCISPTGQIAKDYTTTQLPAYLMGNVPATVTSIAASSLQDFYNDLYKYLSASGITFVKTDVQHMPSTFRSRSSRLELTTPYQTAWLTAHNKYFNSKAISCMSQIPQTLYASLLQTHTPRVVLRNSDDFYPEVAASHPWHIWANAHNALFTRYLNVVPDWDMFQTDHAWSAYHGAARCISGGPIMITDVPGEHDVELIGRMTGVDGRRRRVALRPGVARTTRVFDEYTDGKLLRVGSVMVGKSGQGIEWQVSLLGLWNIAERAESAMVAVTEFPEIQSVGSNVVIGSYRSGQFFGPFDTAETTVVDATGLIYVTVPMREWDILTAYPVLQPVKGREDVQIAVVGLTDKISGAAGVLDVETGVGGGEGKVTVKVSLKALGRLGVWMAGVKDGSGIVTVQLQGESIAEDRLEVKDGAGAGAGGKVLYVDTEGEWRHRGLFETKQDGIVVEIEVSV